MTEQTIEIDCAPGALRPGDLIVGVIEGTGLKVKESSGRFFGNWSWDYSDVDAETWNNAKTVLKERLTKLYNSGTIRYASW